MKLQIFSTGHDCEIKVEQVSLLYAKHMVFGWKECVKNSLTETLFNVLNGGESVDFQANKSSSFSKQLREVVGSKELHRVDVGEVLKQLEMDYARLDIELREGLVNIFKRLHQECPYACIKELNTMLKVDFNNPVT
jgi:hypothetical protein